MWKEGGGGDVKNGFLDVSEEGNLSWGARGMSSLIYLQTVTCLLIDAHVALAPPQSKRRVPGMTTVGVN